MTSPAPQRISPDRALFLDYLRIFAFASVLIGHKFIGYVEDLALGADWGVLFALPARMVLPFIRDGGVGVVVFFLVSGYIITHVLTTERTPEFLVKRVFRIYPLYVFAVLLEYGLRSIEGTAQDLKTLLLQLSLAGDIFHAPYALKGVEWTLRVEMAFYLLMALFKQIGLMAVPMRKLSLGLLGTALLCVLVAPIPDIGGWSRGYLTIYGPFLLLGSCVYLYQIGAASSLQLGLMALLTFCVNYSLLMMYKPGAVGAHFGALACLLFLLAWIQRERLPKLAVVIFLSELTYSVYLFHNWVFDYFSSTLEAWMPRIAADICSLLALLVFCAALVRVIEKPGIRLGRRLLGTRRA